MFVLTIPISDLLFQSFDVCYESFFDSNRSALERSNYLLATLIAVRKNVLSYNQIENTYI